MAQSVLEALERHATTDGGKIAVREVDASGQRRDLTYAELVQCIAATAREVQRVVGGNEPVLLCQTNGLDCVVGFFACLRAGATAFPVHPSLTDVELRHAVQRSGAKAIIGCDRARRAVADQGFGQLECVLMPEAAGMTKGDFPGSGGMILQSSGTTGLPKLVFRDGPALDAVARNVAVSAELRSSDVVVAAIPLCHSYGVESAMLAPMLAGAMVVVVQRFDPALIVQLFREESITVMPGVPAMFASLALLRGGGPIDTKLRCAYSAGTPLPASVFDDFFDTFGVRLGQLYGATELGSITFSRNEQSYAPGDVGLPMPEVLVHVVRPDGTIHDVVPTGEEGEVAIFTPSMLSRFVDSDASPFEDGFFRTGDLGRIDEQGRLFLTGRIKLLIDVAGLKVNPFEVEQVLCEHAAIAECVVVPVPVSPTVSRIKAVVTTHIDHDSWPLDDVRRFARERLAPHKLPRLFELRASLPKSATGKILRNRIT